MNETSLVLLFVMESVDIGHLATMALSCELGTSAVSRKKHFPSP